MPNDGIILFLEDSTLQGVRTFLIEKIMDKQKILQEYRGLFPFLQVIPDAIYFQLGIREFHLPSKEIFHLVSELAEKINHHVLTYNAYLFDTSITPEQHLCALLQGATLSKKKRDLLAEYERKTKKQGITLVVYQKPATLAEMKQTALYQYYEKNNLIKKFQKSNPDTAGFPLLDQGCLTSAIM